MATTELLCETTVKTIYYFQFVPITTYIALIGHGLMSVKEAQSTIYQLPLYGLISDV